LILFSIADLGFRVLLFLRFFAEPVLSGARFFPFGSFLSSGLRVRMTRSEGLAMTPCREILNSKL